MLDDLELLRGGHEVLLRLPAESHAEQAPLAAHGLLLGRARGHLLSLLWEHRPFRLVEIQGLRTISHSLALNGPVMTLHLNDVEVVPRRHPERPPGEEEDGCDGVEQLGGVGAGRRAEQPLEQVQHLPRVVGQEADGAGRRGVRLEEGGEALGKGSADRGVPNLRCL